MANIYEQQVVDNPSQPIQGVEMRDDSAEKMRRQAAQFEKTANHNYSQQLQTDAATMMNDAYSKYADDPDMLEQTLGDIRKGMLSKIVRPDVATDFLTNFDLKKSSMVANARVHRENTQRKETKSTMSDALVSNLGDLTEAAIGVFSADDDDVKVGYAHAKQSALGALGSKHNNGTNVFTDSERKTGGRNISKSSLVGLQTFLADPTADENRKAEIINRFNNGQYKDMFDPEDYPKAMRLIKAASRQSGGSGSSSKESLGESLQYVGFDEQLTSDFKDKKTDKAATKGNLKDLLAFRQQVSDSFESGYLNKKEYNALMSATAQRTLRQFENDNNEHWVISHVPPQYYGIRKVRAELNKGGFSDDEKLAIYEEFMNEFARQQAPTNASAESDKVAEKIANGVIERFIKHKFPGFDSETASAVVMGRQAYRLPGSVGKPVQGGVITAEY